MKKYLFAIMYTSICIVLFSCASNKIIEKPEIQIQEDTTDILIQKGTDAWNNKDPTFAIDYWIKINDPSLQKAYLNYVYSYQDAVEKLENIEGSDSKNKNQMIEECKEIISIFTEIDSSLRLPADIRISSCNLTYRCVDKLLSEEKINSAKDLYNSAVKVFGEYEDLKLAKKEIDIVSFIQNKINEIKQGYDNASCTTNSNLKIKEYDNTYTNYKEAEETINAMISSSVIANSSGIDKTRKNFKSIGQNIKIAREKVIREKAYTYREKISTAFARKPTSGSGKKGAITSEDILDLYKSIQREINNLYDELTDFRNSYPDAVGADIMDEINNQKNTLNSEIAKITKEVQNEKEVESRGKSVFPVMIGLFNSDAGQSENNKKSKPATFSSTNGSKDEYWWGMVEIPSGVMNDLVITLKDNRTVRVFNDNTKNGKNIAKKENDTKKLHDLVSQNSRIGNSWPVLNAGKQLNGSLYYFEVQKGKTDNYSGEAVVYSSFITRMR